MTIRLRPHHLLCLLTYVGKGYSAAFVANLDRVADRLAAGEGLALVEGPDDICAPLLPGAAAAGPAACAPPDPAPPGAQATPHCLAASVRARDALALDSLREHLPPQQPGERLLLAPPLVARLRGLFATGQIRQACGGCEWHGLCTDVAAAGYAGVRLQVSASPSADPVASARQASGSASRLASATTAAAPGQPA